MYFMRCVKIYRRTDLQGLVRKWSATRERGNDASARPYPSIADLSENLIQHTGAVKALYPTLLTSAVRADFGIDAFPLGGI